MMSMFSTQVYEPPSVNPWPMEGGTSPLHFSSHLKPVLFPNAARFTNLDRRCDCLSNRLSKVWWFFKIFKGSKLLACKTVIWLSQSRPVVSLNSGLWQTPHTLVDNVQAKSNFGLFLVCTEYFIPLYSIYLFAKIMLLSPNH